MAIFIAVIIAVGLLFIQIPNVEMVTATIFIAGYVLGTKKGVLVALSGELIFSLLNPYGAPNPVLLAAQLISMGIVAYSGSLLYRMNTQVPSFIARSIQLGLAGFIVTLIYDLLTTFSFAIILAKTPAQIIATAVSGLMMGLPFTLIHLAGNTLAFAIIIPLLLNALLKIDYFKPRLSAILVLLVMLLCLSGINHPGYAIEPAADILNHAPAKQQEKKAAPRDLLHKPIENSVQDSKEHVLSDTIKVDQGAAGIDSLQLPEGQTVSDSLSETVRDTGPSAIATSQRKIMAYDTTTLELNNRTSHRLTRESIRKLIYQTSGDIVDNIPGFYSPRLHRPGEMVEIYRQGLATDYFGFTYEGHPIRNPIYDTCDLNFIPIEGIDKITVPLSAAAVIVNNPVEFYGERFEDHQPYTRVFFHIGPSEFSDTDVGFGRRISTKSDAMIGLTLKSNDGPLRPDSYEHHQGRALVHYGHSDGWDLSFAWIYNRLKHHAIGEKLPDGRYATPGARSLIYRNDHSLTLKGNLFKSHYQNFISTLYFSRETVDFKDNDYRIKYDEKATYVGLVSKLETYYKTFKFGASAKVEYDWVNACTFGKDDATVYAAGFNEQWNFAENFYLNAMFGTDGRTGHEPGLKSHLSLDWLPTTNFSLSSGANQFHRYPSFYEMHSRDKLAEFHDLKSEQINRLFLNLSAKPFESMMVRMGAFMNRVDDPIAWGTVNDTTAAFVNFDELRYIGFDASFEVSFLHDFSIGSIFNYVDEDRDMMNRIPRMTLTGYLGYDNIFFKGDLIAKLRVEGILLDERQCASRGYLFGYDASMTALPRDYVINLVGFFRILKAFEGFISLENLLGREYQYVPGYPMPERVFHYGLRWEFLD